MTLPKLSNRELDVAESIIKLLNSSPLTLIECCKVLEWINQTMRKKLSEILRSDWPNTGGWS
jgi:hypothetical protein